MQDFTRSIAVARRYLNSFQQFSEFYKEESQKQLAEGQIGDDGFGPADRSHRELVDKTLKIGRAFTALASDNGQDCDSMRRFLVLLENRSDSDSLEVARIDALVELDSLADAANVPIAAKDTRTEREPNPNPNAMV